MRGAGAAVEQLNQASALGVAIDAGTSTATQAPNATVASGHSTIVGSALPIATSNQSLGLGAVLDAGSGFAVQQINAANASGQIVVSGIANLVQQLNQCAANGSWIVVGSGDEYPQASNICGAIGVIQYAFDPRYDVLIQKRWYSASREPLVDTAYAGKRNYTASL